MPPAKKEDPLLILWKRAQDGDSAALEELAKGVSQWTKAKAREYARTNSTDAADLISIANLAFLEAVKYFKPKYGSFLNYYASCASRAMLRSIRGRKDAPKYPDPVFADSAATEKVASQDRGDGGHQDLKQALKAIRLLAPAEQAILRALTNCDPDRPVRKKLQMQHLAATLRVEIHEAEAIVAHIRAKTVERIEKPPGRPPDPVNVYIAKLSSRRRGEGKSWKEIAKEVRLTYGRALTQNALCKSLSRRTKMEDDGSRETE